MSSIIKGHRIIGESVINLEERARKQIEKQIEKQMEKQEIGTLAVAAQEVVAASNLIEEAKENANQIIIEAMEKATSILEEATKKKEKLEEETRLQIEEALLESDKKLQEELYQLDLEKQQIIEAAYKEKESIIEGAEPEIIALVHKLLAHIVGEEMYENTEWLKVMIKKMIATENITDTIEVILSPENYEKMMAEQWALTQKINCSFSVEDTMENSTCIVKTAKGDIAYNVKEGLEKVLREIKILQTLK